MRAERLCRRKESKEFPRGRGACGLPARLKYLQCLGDGQKTICFELKEEGNALFRQP